MRDETVNDTGEFGLIARLEAALPAAVRHDPSLRLGIGDDAAVWTPSPGESLVITTDSLVEEVHFRLDWTDWESLGHKSLAVNVSDIAAMGAAPRLAVITLGLRGTERVADLEAFYRGFGNLALQSGTLVAGGDIVASPRSLAIHVTVIGETRAGCFLTRSGAQVGDVIAVSGTIGASAAGYLLLHEPAGATRRTAATAERLIAAHLRPEPRIALGKILLEQGASAAMDLSDGLFGDLPKIADASKVGAVVDTAQLPVAASVRALFPDRWLELATRGGEDYELLLTASQDRFPAIREAAEALGATLTEIGKITPRRDDAPLWIRGPDGFDRPLEPGAFDHFR